MTLVADYAEVLTDEKVFKDNLNEIEKVKCESKSEKEYFERIRGFYFLACDHAIAEGVENSSSTKYFRYMTQMQEGNIYGGMNHVVDIEETMESAYREIHNLVGSHVSFDSNHYVPRDDIPEYGKLTIIGAKYDPPIGIDLSSTPYFAEGETTPGNGTNNEGMTEGDLSDTTQGVEQGNSDIEWYDLTELSGDVSPFFGIWVAAAESKEEAVMLAKELTSEGVPICIFYSDNWSGMNKNGVYALSAGVYGSESEANMVIDGVKKYCPDAVVKYSGEFIEHP